MIPLHFFCGCVCVFGLHFYTFTPSLVWTKRLPTSENPSKTEEGKIESLTFSPKQITRAIGKRMNRSRMLQMKIEKKKGGKKRRKKTRKKTWGGECPPFYPKTLRAKFSNLACERKRGGGGAFQAPSANFRHVRPRTAILSRDHFSPADDRKCKGL